jgi:hypothetical protein
MENDKSKFKMNKKNKETTNHTNNTNFFLVLVVREWDDFAF